MDSYLSRTLTEAQAKEQYNYYAKRLLSARNVLGYILIQVVPEFRGRTLEVAMNAIDGDPIVSRKDVRSGRVIPEAITTNPGESPGRSNGGLYYDIIFRVYTPSGEHQELWINVEAQKSFYPGYDLVPRGLFYTASILRDELDRDFSPRNYDDIKKVYSVWICMNPPHRDRLSRSVENTIVAYQTTPSVLYAENDAADTADSTSVHTGRHDLMTTIFVNLSKDGHSQNPLIGMLSTLFASDIPIEDKKRILAEKYNLPMTITMEEDTNTMCNLGEWMFECAQVAAEEKVAAQMEARVAEKVEAVTAKAEARGEARAEARYRSAIADRDAEITRLKAMLAAATASHN